MGSRERKHFERVGILCNQIGNELGLSKRDIKNLTISGLYHDIGKISIPEKILNKTESLTDKEYEIIKTHSKYSYDMLKAVKQYKDLAVNALYHHERWDGLGYPEGKKGNDIPLFSRIICVADAYDAMISKRPYKKNLSKQEAIEELIRCSGTQFDPDIVQVFINGVLN